MHRFACTPGHAELVCNGVPEVGFEATRNVSWFGSEGCGYGEFLSWPRRRVWTGGEDHTGRRLLRACCVAPHPSRLASRGSSGSVICRRWGCGLGFPG